MPTQLAHALMEVQAARTPDAEAVVYESARWTYRELDRAANNVAAALVRAGVGPGSVVGVCITPSLESIAALYGVWKANAAHLPLDPASPPDRRDFICADAKVAAVLVSADVPQSFRVPTLELVAATRQDGERPETRREGKDPAYVIYTSGSTGVPKGVVVSHRALVAHNRSVAALLELAPGERIHQFTPLNFDAAGEAIYPALSVGATVVVRGKVAPSPAEFQQLIEQQRLTCLTLPPIFLHTWILDVQRRGLRIPPSIRRVVLGGDRVSYETWRMWCELGGAQIPWLNHYGPTEATITSTVFVQRGAASATGYFPIGRPLPHVTVSLLDPSGKPVAPGELGEIVIGGEAIADGYLNQPALTAEKFVTDPSRGRCYRTGDLGRWRADGQLEFAGRVDDQVKIRGFRVELGEIEAALRLHPQLKEVAVVPREDAQRGLELIGYVVPRQPVKSRELRAFLQAKLPEYMVPRAFVELAVLPVTPNGKLDRRALPAPPEEVAEAAPELGPVETDLAGIFAEVLGTAARVDDNFFDLGGQSILAMQVISRVQERFGVDVPMRSFFEEPTIAALSRFITAAAGDVDGMSDAQVEAMIQNLARAR